MWVQGLGFRDLTPIAETQMEKSKQHEKVSEVYAGA